jgi:aldehyde dehydrogenase (NAD+)
MWQGADVVITSKSPTIDEGGFYPAPRSVVTAHASELSWLFEQVRDIFMKIDDYGYLKEEIFGPILPMITWKDESDLARVISLHPDPLAFYIFTERRDFSDRLLKGYSFGGACVNHIALHLGCPDLPFGGRKTSGVGQYHGRYGFDAFTHYKGVVEASSMFDVRLKYPPYGKIDGFLKWFYL